MAEQRDDLTQLLTRAALDAALAQRVADARQTDQPLSVVFGDVDHFKRVNDSHGHSAGDAVLREVARRLVQVAHGKGDVYRYGGEEMTLVLANHTVEEAVAVAERCRRAIEHTTIAGMPVSMSFGVATLPDHAEDATALTDAADKAMYDAKNRGRNLVRAFGEPPPTRPGPRQPERKAPEPGKLTDRQKVELRRQLLRREEISCPEDGAFFEVHDVTTFGSVGRDFAIECPECGLSEELSSGG